MWLGLCGLCLVLPSILVPIQGSLVCPASFAINRGKQRSYFYPINIYAPQSVIVNASKRSFPCKEYWNNSDPIQRCSHQDTFCPLNKVAVGIAAPVNHDKPALLCRFVPILQDPSQKMRIIVTGSSLIRGINAKGCNIKNSWGSDDSTCSWFHHFGQWIIKEYNAHITQHKLLDFRQQDDSIIFRQRRLAELMVLEGIDKFTANDIIFLDHSIEDDCESADRVEAALELLIRRIYLQSEKHSWPTIAILDSAHTRNAATPYKSPLAESYNKIAKKYHALVWSFREAVLSKSVLLHSKYDFRFMNRTFTELPANLHPPWHHHLAMADLYAAIFQRDLQQCANKGISKLSQIHHSELVLPTLQSQELTECERNAGGVFEYMSVKTSPEKFVSKATDAQPAYRIVRLDQQFTRWPADYKWFADGYQTCGEDPHFLDSYDTIRVDDLTSKWNWNNDEAVNRELEKVFSDPTIKCPVFKAELFLSLLRNKVMGILGDSLSNQMYQGILNHLRVLPGRITYSRACEEGSSCDEIFWVQNKVYIHDYNATIYRYDSGRFDELDKTYPCPLAGTDVLIIAIGSWFKPGFRDFAPGPYYESYDVSKTQLNDTLHMGLKFFQEKIPGAKRIWRTVPHAGKIDEMTALENNTACVNHRDGMFWSRRNMSAFFPLSYNEIIRKIAAKNGDSVIDWYPLSLTYIDYLTHRGHPTHIDSVHYCATTLPKGGALLVQDALYDLFSSNK